VGIVTPFNCAGGEGDGSRSRPIVIIGVIGAMGAGD